MPKQPVSEGFTMKKKPTEKQEPKKKKRAFNPAADYPTVNIVLTCLLIATIPWLFTSVLQTYDQRILLAQCLGGFLAAIVIIEFVSEKLGIFLSSGPLRGEPFKDPLDVIKSMEVGKKSKQLAKFKGQVWQLVIHVVMVYLETRVLSDLAFQGKDFFELPYRMSLVNEGNTELLETVYIMQMGVWVVTGLFCVFVFERQSDYLVMLGHHVATIALLGVSLQNNYSRFGIAVLYIHDISDIVIDLLKLTNYLKLDGLRGFFIVETVFITNLGSWAYYRLYVFPYTIIYKGCYIGVTCAFSFFQHSSGGGIEGVLQWGDEGVATRLNATTAYMKDNNLCYQPEFPDVGAELLTGGVSHCQLTGVPFSDCATTIFYSGLVATVLLSVLCLMHVYWYALFLRILHGLLTNDDAHETGAATYEGDDGLQEDAKDHTD